MSTPDAGQRWRRVASAPPAVLRRERKRSSRARVAAAALNGSVVVLANASKYGTGAVINPTGELDDGAFEVVIVRRLALSELLKMLYKPQPFNPKKIETFSATAIKLETVRSVHFQIDGEYMGKINKLNAKILPDYINMVLPSSV